MTIATSHEDELLLNTVRSFMEAEIYPHEEHGGPHRRDSRRDLGRQIESRAKEVGLFAANLPEDVGGGGLGYRQMALIEREYGKTSHALHSAGSRARPNCCWPARAIRLSAISTALRDAATNANFLP